jgi:hypothetical protein
LWVDASLVGMKQEIGLVWRTYPTVLEIYMVLPGITEDDAEWIWNACNFGDRVLAVIVLNDVARALIGGVPITEIRERGLQRMLEPAVWERK